ncbi:MAG TPA: hypothetical protein VEZ90_12670 [Blastocatellia bacterium]|nr:hypothetical protein [Blastocatellia bacterium]
MSKTFKMRLAVLLCSAILGLSLGSLAQSFPAVLTGKDLSKVVPTSFYFQGESGPTQMRNSAAVQLSATSYVVAGLVDTAGYSSEVRGKYVGFFITDSPISIEGADLATGAYGFGFSADGHLNLFDVGGKAVLTVPAHKDEQMKRPRPLVMARAADGVRLYNGPNYVTFTQK